MASAIIPRDPRDLLLWKETSHSYALSPKTKKTKNTILIVSIILVHRGVSVYLL